MTRVLFAVTGSRHWTLKDGTQHSCGYWPEELAVPHQVFADAGLDITIATPGAVAPVADEAGFTAAMNGGSEEPGQRFRAYLDSIQREVNSPADLNEVSADDFDIVFIPGGHGPMEDLAASPGFGSLIVEFTRQNKPVAAVCHGPGALASAADGDGWIFSGRRVTGFTNVEEGQVGLADKAPWLLEDRLKELGGVFEASSEAWHPHFAVDGNLFTGQNPASSLPLAQVVLSAVASARS